MTKAITKIFKLEFGKRFYIGAALAALSMVLCSVFALAKVGLLFAIAFLVSGAFSFGDGFSRKLEGAIFAIYALGVLAITSIGPNISFRYDLSELGKHIYPNYIIILTVYMVVLLVSGRPRFSLVATALLVNGITVVNWFVFHFRGTELTPADFTSIGIALEVAGEYTMRRLGPRITYVICFAVLAIFATFIFRASEFSRKKIRIIAIILWLVCIGSVAYLSQGVSPIQWRRNGSIRRGLYYNLFLITRESFVEKPEGYSPEATAEIASRYADDNQNTEASGEERPNIIVIMNESWADMNAIGDLHADVDELTPFINSLTDNTIKGVALCSTYGGGTSRSEFEFLTGTSMAFLPPDSIPYHQFVRQETASLPSYLKTIGYEVEGTHPFVSSGWRRDRVYPLLGIENPTFRDDYPEDSDMLRSYISDEGMYDYMLGNERLNDKKAPTFYLGVTMQNHGGYNYSKDDFKTRVHLDEDFYGAYCPKAEQYLTLMLHTDEAFEKLVKRVSKLDQKTVILMFGDHQVSLESTFYNKLSGGAYGSNSDQMQYKVPFIIWANYDIEEYDVDITSLSYLPIYMMEACGLELPPYYEFLKDVREEIPAINDRVYYSRKAGKFVSIDSAKGDEARILNEYAIVQYNNLFDGMNRNEIFYKM